MKLKKILLAVYLLWASSHFIAWAKEGFKMPGTEIKRWTSGQYFFPFDTKIPSRFIGVDPINFYDLSEFLVYLLVPIAVFYAFVLIISALGKS